MPALNDLVPTEEAGRPAKGWLHPDAVISDTYRITRLLGAGGMGEVYEAEHLRIGRSVAVKVLRSGSDQRAVNRFRRETRIVAALDSDHVVEVFDCGSLKCGTPYLVMELLRGEDLRAVLACTGPLATARAVRIVQQAARGVTAAHRAGVVHRDLKPENLFLLRRDGDVELCKVLDFGVAKTNTSELTQEGTVIGTIKYMAPEQLEDSTRVGPATDVYALGVILYECLVGDAPHEAITARETMLKILTEPVRPVRVRRPDVPEALSAIVLRALARLPQDRFQSAADFERALEPFAQAREQRGVELLATAAPTLDLPPAEQRDSPLPAAALSSSPDLTKKRGRMRGVALSIAMGLGGVAVGATLAWLLSSKEPPIMPVTLNDEARTAAVRAAPVSSLAPASAEVPRRGAIAGPPPPLSAPPADDVRPSSTRAPRQPEASATGGLPALHLERENPYAAP